MEDRNGNTLLLAAAGAGALAALVGGRALLRRWRAWDPRGRCVLITGSSRGLGLVLAREFAREGARLALCARDEAALERAREELAASGAEVAAFRCDVTDRDDVERMVAAVRTRFGAIDTLVNNAGLIQVGPMEVMTLADYEEAMKTHFWAPLYTTLAVLPEMRERREGRIVNISSIGGKISVPHLLPYSASKFALVGLSEGLRAELAKDGIAVTTVIPGLMRTGGAVNAFFKGRHRAEYAWFSVSDALPGASISAESAARQIVNACRRGDAEAVLSLPAQAAVLFHGIAPGPTADILGVVNQLLPRSGGIGAERLTGKESASPVSPSPLTALNDRAALANNQSG
jgi:short-subunit dehydrogenase